MKEYKTDIGTHTMNQLMMLTGRSRSAVTSRIRSGASLKPDSMNKSDRMIEHNGQSKPASDWLKTVRSPPLKTEFMQRIRAGWTVDRALSPVKSSGRTRKDGDKLPEELQEITDAVADKFGHNPKLLHAARLQAQGLSDSDIQRRIALL
jgi:hypothetical protein